MERYHGMSLGLCVNNDDPEKRGRVQVFVPHIMPALYDGWNKDAKDIDIVCVGDNIPNSLTSTQIEKLKQILPWAEAASPIIGGSSPGNVVTQTLSKVAGAVAGAAKSAAHYLFDQSPVAQPHSAAPQDQSALFNAASKYGGVSPEELASNSSSTGQCGVGSRSILGGLTGNSYFAQGLGIGGDSTAASLAGGGNNYLTNSGFFNNGGQPADLNAFSDPSKIPIGTTVAATGGHTGQGHVQVWTGSGWVSNFSQNADGASAVPGTNGILGSSGGVPYDNFTVYYPTTPIGGGAADPNQQATVADQTSVAGETSSAAPHGTTNPIAANSDSKTLDGSAADPTVQNNTAGVSSNPNGTVDPNNLQSYIENRIANSPLNGYVPADGAKYGIDGTPSSWANYFVNLSNRESSLNNNTVGDIGKFSGNSNGLFQLSPNDAVNYGLNGGAPFTQEQLTDPTTNTNAAIAITEKLVLQDGAIGSDANTGAARYWGPLRNGWTPPANSNYDAIVAEQNAKKSATSNLVHNTCPHGAVATQPLNNTAKGLFTYPAAGAMLWVFFREGNPLYPVYFAASYSADDWKSATRHGSDGPLMTPIAGESGVTSTGTILNLHGVGGIRAQCDRHPTDPTKNKQGMMFFGEDGSNMFMGTGYHQIFSKFDRRDQVEGDRWNTTLGHKEDWVQGDHNHVTLGDVFVKIGNVSQPAVDAVTRIQQLIKEGHKPLTDLK